MPRILFVTNSPPHPPTIGGNQRSNLIYRALTEIGDTDILLALDSADLPRDHLQTMKEEFGLVRCVPPAAAGKRWPWRLVAPFSSQTADRLALYLGDPAADYRPDPELNGRAKSLVARSNYDLVVGRQLKILAKSGLLNHPRVILDVDDLDTAYYQSQLNLPTVRGLKRMLLDRTVRRLGQSLPDLFGSCAALWVTKPEDCAVFGSSDVRVLPNIPFLPINASCASDTNEQAESSIVLTVASISQRPNHESIDWFVREVWPLVIHQVPQARFRIVGSGLTNEDKQRWGQSPGVEPVGFAEDLCDEYARSAITVSPVLWGGGTNIKVLESLALGRPCVVSAFSHKGFGDVLKHTESLYVGDCKEAMAKGCVTLLREPALRASMAARGRELVEKHFSYDVFREVVASTVRNVIEMPGKDAS